MNEKNENIEELIPGFSSKKLCQIIVVFRHFGLRKDLAILSMEELSKRRLDGDEFKFEDYIEESLNNLPKIDLKMPNLNEILSGIKL